jgi:hypothetical protein
MRKGALHGAPFFLPLCTTACRTRQSPCALLRLKSSGESLGLRDALHLECNRIDRGLDPLQSAIYCAQLTRRHRPRLQPLGDQPDDRKAEYEGYDSGNDPGEYFVNDQVRIWRHLYPFVRAATQPYDSSKLRFLPPVAANELHLVTTRIPRHHRRSRATSISLSVPVVVCLCL